MRPPQSHPNEFELAILLQLARQLPGLANAIPHLRVRSRWSSAVGISTSFEPADPITGADRPIGLTRPIAIPGLQRGLDAILFFEDARVNFLELVTSGGEPWDGRFDGFSIPLTA